ncbi:hypothetical protein Glove_637g10 [Diversispora epigaea]|uniref:mannan endo-1,4-beta-mannosidase n=1 Tax=Diversispora epigaea TaxID=1348612 RepID=A0A397G9I2_9GLOM|nr:hypothetical protein Glove_637g10 [Diversispora epigaea]
MNRLLFYFFIYLTILIGISLIFEFIQTGFDNSPFGDLISSMNYNKNTTETTTTTIITTGSEETESSKFAKVDNNGTGFILDNKPFYIVGANYWQAMNLGMSNKGEEGEGGGGNRSRVIKDLTTLKKYGINCIRIMAGTEGPPGEPQRMYPALMNYPGEYDEKVFQGLDWFLDQLRNFEMTAIMTLSNYWQWSGGFAQYVNWADNNTNDNNNNNNNSSKIPYPKKGSKDFTKFEKYAARFYSDPKILDVCQNYYLNHVKTVVNRKNTVNGIHYKDDPVIFAWELANEPQAIFESNNNNSNSNSNSNSNNSDHEYVYKWIDSSANYIKSLDSNHLVTTGSESKNGEEWFVTMHKSKNIDFSCAHVWVENWGYYNSDDSSIENYQKAENFMLNFLQNVSDWSINILHKPIILEEYGMARDGWSGLSKYSSDAPITNKNKYFTAISNKILELMHNNNNNNNTFSGNMFWAYAGIARPTDNSPQWLGDPPHEPSGWYSVYDSDIDTLNIFANHAKEISKIIN